MKTLKFFATLCFALCFLQIGAQNFTVDGINYWVCTPGEVQVEKGNYSGDITIPSQVTDNSVTYSVTKISGGAFSSCYITSITVLEGIKEIGSNAFSSCIYLQTINLPSTVTNMPASAVHFCTKLTAINVAAGNLDYVSYDGILFSADMKTIVKVPAGGNVTGFKVPEGIEVIGEQAFADKAKLTSITLPTTLTTIEESAFAATGITKVDIPEGVTTIGRNAFDVCKNLTEINISSTVNSIGSNIAGFCQNLTAINVAAGNTHYKSIDGVLFSFDGKVLQEYPRGKTDVHYDIPEGVTTIADYAFFASCPSQSNPGCNHLSSVNIPASVTFIGNAPFTYSPSIQTVKVVWDNPDKVTLASALSLAGFTDTEGIVLYVPKGSKNAYQTAPVWSHIETILEYDNSTTDIPGIAGKNTSIRVEGNHIIIENNPSESVSIYNLEGVCVAQGTGTVFPVSQAGIYIVRTGTVTEKIIVK